METPSYSLLIMLENEIFAKIFPCLRILLYITYVLRRGLVNLSPSQVLIRFWTSRDDFESRKRRACISSSSLSIFPSRPDFSICRNLSIQSAYSREKNIKIWLQLLGVRVSKTRLWLFSYDYYTIYYRRRYLRIDFFTFKIP